MTDGLARGNAHLDRNRQGREGIATALRERRAITFHTTVAAPLRSYIWSSVRSSTRSSTRLIAALVIALAAGCGGAAKSDTYVRATDVQGQCCENLTGAERDRCLAEIVRVEDPAAAKTSTSQATYACVAEHFVCNPATGRPTQPSAQAQYDCIEDQQP